MFAVVGQSEGHDAAIAYAATGDRRYADLVRKVLLHYTSYEFFAVHPDCGLNWSVWCMPALYGLRHRLSTPSTEPRRRSTTSSHARSQRSGRTTSGGCATSWAASSTTTSPGTSSSSARTASSTASPSSVDYAMESDQGIRELIENGSRDDGLWLEGQPQLSLHGAGGARAFRPELANTGIRSTSGTAGSPTAAASRIWSPGRSRPSSPTRPSPRSGTPTLADAAGRHETGSTPPTTRISAPSWPGFCGDRRRCPPTRCSSRTCRQETAPADEDPALARARLRRARTQEGADYWKGDGYSAFLSYDTDGIHSHRDKFDLMVFARGGTSRSTSRRRQARSTRSHRRSRTS